MRSSSSDPADVTVFRLIGLTGLCDAGSPELLVRQGVKHWTGIACATRCLGKINLAPPLQLYGHVAAARLPGWSCLELVTYHIRQSVNTKSCSSFLVDQHSSSGAQGRAVRIPNKSGQHVQLHSTIAAFHMAPPDSHSGGGPSPMPAVRTSTTLHSTSQELTKRRILSV